MSDKYLLLLFDRPYEPIFVPKGEGKINFDVPVYYLTNDIGTDPQKILDHFGKDANSSIPIKSITIPDLSIPLSLGRKECFSIFIPSHREKAAVLVKLFMDMPTVDDLLSLACYCRDRVNSQMFVYALYVAILHRDDTKNLEVPQLSEVFPDKFMDSAIFSQAKREANIAPAGSRTPIEVPMNYTASNDEPEQRVAYWREDVGINLHHWHWHLVYPFSGPPRAVNKDRRGELFYYMHHQTMARYNTERFCNDLPRVAPLSDFREPIPEGYFPKMDQEVAGRAWPGRPVSLFLTDLNRRNIIQVGVADIEKSRDRITEAIITMTAITQDGRKIQLDDVTGIDILGNMVEASQLSPNLDYYGDIHNNCHTLIAYIHDPDGRFLESFAVMGDTTTAMRDPIFYRWHGFLDQLFTNFKDSLTPYSPFELNFPGVVISDIRVVTPGATPNILNTHWNKSDIDLSRGLDFTPRGSVLARLQHLNHDEYSYGIIVHNSNAQEVTGTVRIFIAPKFDEKGRSLSFNDQRMLMIEMDKFTVRLKSGRNDITRHSLESSLTIPFESTFRNLDRGRPEEGGVRAADGFNFCGCGWPQHMLVPKGTRQGYPMDLFVMISNYEIDRVNQPEPTGCRDGVSFCGLRDLKYPDKRAMGFPFDRMAPINVKSMKDFCTPNMKTQPITVKFSNRIKARQEQYLIGGN